MESRDSTVTLKTDSGCGAKFVVTDGTDHEWLQIWPNDSTSNDDNLGIMMTIGF